MEEQALRETIARRIAFFWRQAGQTQAEKLNSPTNLFPSGSVRRACTIFT